MHHIPKVYGAYTAAIWSSLFLIGVREEFRQEDFVFLGVQQ